MFGDQRSDEWLFESRQLTEARSRVLYQIQSQAPVAHIAADDGSGRSTLMQLLQRDLRRMGYSVVSTNLSAADASSFVQQLSDALAIPSNLQSTVAARLLQIREELLGRTGCGRHTVLLLDDVHRGEPNTDSVIEFLTSVAESGNGLLCVVTAGNEHGSCMSARRSPMRIKLSALAAQEANEFLQERLIRLGVPQARITSSAIRTLVEGTQGLPRRLLHVCNLVNAVCQSNTAVQIHASDANAVMSTGLNRAA
jgi:type II secretory pathway predicted ATPase ExeA